jgi:hypothetical protein
VSAETELFLPKTRRLAGGDEDLLADEVDSGDQLGDRVLDLNACVHLEEPVVALAVEEALDGARTPVADGPRGLDRDLADVLAELRTDRRRGRLLDELLVAALNRAVALTEMEHGAVVVGEDLHLDVPRVGNELLHVDGRVGEVRLALPLSGRERALRLPGGLDDLEALSPSPCRGLDRERPAELVAQPTDLGCRRDRLRRAGNDRDSCAPHQLPGRHLRSHHLDRLGRRTDPDQPRIRAGTGE